MKNKKMMQNFINNNKLLKEIDIFVNKLPLTSEIKSRLKLILIRYEYSRINKLNSYTYDLENIDINKLSSHLVGFLDGDGCLKHGKRKGHKPGLYRFSPAITLELSADDCNYLNLIKKVLLSEKKKLYLNKSKNSLTLTINSKQELDIIMKIIDNNHGFLSQNKSKNYILFKDLLAYIENTKLLLNDEVWLNKGIEVLKDFNTTNNHILSEKLNEKEWDKIKTNLSIEYIIGFIEAEGSLILHYNSIKDNIFNSFEITQNESNDLILKGILEYIKNYNDPLIIYENVDINTKGIVKDNGKSRNNTLSRLTLTNNDVLLLKIIPILLSSNFYSKMQTNLVYWIFGVIICKYLKKNEECRNLYFDLKEVINTNSCNLLDLHKILIILNKYL